MFFERHYLKYRTFKELWLHRGFYVITCLYSVRDKRTGSKRCQLGEKTLNQREGKGHLEQVSVDCQPEVAALKFCQALGN